MPKYRLLSDQDTIQPGDEIWLPSWQRKGGWVEVVEVIFNQPPGGRIIRRLNKSEQDDATITATGEGN